MPTMSQKRQNAIFSTIKSEGSVLPMDLLRRVSDPQNAQLSGLTPDDYNDSMWEASGIAWSNPYNGVYPYPGIFPSKLPYGRCPSDAFMPDDGS